MQKIVDAFLTAYKAKKIALYGTGLNAERLLSSVKGYFFSCVISNDDSIIGNEFCGKKVLCLNDAISQADVILIAAIPSSTRIIYERIKDAVPESIPVFDLSGTQLNKRNSYLYAKYWNTTYSSLLQAIDAHDVISFDIYDTLLMRKIVHPRAILGVIEDEVCPEIGQQINDYASIRTQVEDSLYKANKHPTIFDIYDCFQNFYKDLSENQINKLLNLELKCECKITTKRFGCFNAFEYALEKKKKVFLVSDMYFPKQILEKILVENGINGYFDILVSCDYKCNKAGGKLFEKLSQKAGTDNILHIGDNMTSDIEGAHLSSIDAFQIYSSENILLTSSAESVIRSLKNPWDEMVLGHILADTKVFNSPFEMGRYRGRLYIDTVEMLTELCFVPITMAFISWIINCLKGNNKSLVLFSSRDGFYLDKIYKKIRKEHTDMDLPESKYFYTSRKAMSEAISFSEENIRTLCANLDQYRKVEIIAHLEKIFGVPLREELKQYRGKRFGDIDRDQLLNDLLEHKEKIYEHSRSCIIGYRRYIEGLKMNDYDEIYLVDLVAQGSSRYGLSQICGKEVTLLALGTTKVPNAFISDTSLARSLFGEMVTGVGSAVSTLFNLLEMVYGSKEGQLIGFTEDGKPVFDESTRYNPKLLDLVQDKISNFLDLYADSKWFLRDYTNDFCDEMLGIIRANSSDISEGIREYFQFYDPLNEKNDRYNVLDDVRGT